MRTEQQQLDSNLIRNLVLRGRKAQAPFSKNIELAANTKFAVNTVDTLQTAAPVLLAGYHESLRRLDPAYKTLTDTPQSSYSLTKNIDQNVHYQVTYTPRESIVLSYTTGAASPVATTYDVQIAATGEISTKVSYISTQQQKSLGISENNQNTDEAIMSAQRMLRSIIDYDEEKIADEQRTDSYISAVQNIESTFPKTPTITESRVRHSEQLLLYAFMQTPTFQRLTNRRTSANATEEERLTIQTQIAEEYLEKVTARINYASRGILTDDVAIGVELERPVGADLDDRAKQLATLNTYEYKPPLLLAAGQYAPSEISPLPTSTPARQLMEILALRKLKIVTDTVGPHITRGDVDLTKEHAEITKLTDLMYIAALFTVPFATQELNKINAFLERWVKVSHEDTGEKLIWSGHKRRPTGEIEGAEGVRRVGTEVRKIHKLQKHWMKELTQIMDLYWLGGFAVQAVQKGENQTQQDTDLITSWNVSMQAVETLLHEYHITPVPVQGRYRIITDETIQHRINDTTLEYDKFILQVVKATKEHPEFVAKGRTILHELYSTIIHTLSPQWVGPIPFSNI